MFSKIEIRFNVSLAEAFSDISLNLAFDPKSLLAFNPSSSSWMKD